ncbi:hypothetical protein LCGC14_0871840 [marine sediment metagenome]|uniref:Uncharacterized protein n=1 Tax=marine sediment metagenome TaxID=412755 RepID=A0A0F9P978_9ZZZZ
MSIDEAVAEAIKKYLIAHKYITEEEAKHLAHDAAENIYEQFKVDVKEISADVDKLRKCNDRMWDMLHEIPQSRFAWFHNLVDWLCFWRR